MELTDAGACGGAGADEGLLRDALAVLAAVLIEGRLHIFGVIAADGVEVVGRVLLADDREQTGRRVGQDTQGQGQDGQDECGAHVGRVRWY